MTRFFLQTMLATVLFWNVVQPSIAVALVPGSPTVLSDHSHHVTHRHQYPCSHHHGENGGEGDCACLCCPGHGKVVPQTMFVTSPIPRVLTGYHVLTAKFLTPTAVQLRIERPPQTHR